MCNLPFLNVLKMLIRSHDLMGVWSSSINPKFSEDCIFQTLLPTFEKTLLLFSCTVMSDSLQPHGLQQARLPCPSPSLRACSNSCPLSWWCHSTISFSVVPFFFHFQSFPASGSFSTSQLFASGGQSTGSSASASVFPMRIQGWFPFRLIGLISSLSKGLSRVFSSTTVQKHQFFSALPSLWSSSLSLFSSCSDWNPNSFSESAELNMVCSLRLLSSVPTTDPLHTPLQPQWPSCCSSGKFIPTVTPSFFLHIPIFLHGILFPKRLNISPSLHSVWKCHSFKKGSPNQMIYRSKTTYAAFFTITLLYVLLNRN